MITPGIRIEGAILSPDLLDRLEELPGQRPADFGLDPGTRVKDEIARAWADAQDYWRLYQRRLGLLKADSAATSETRQLWIVPLLGLLGYSLEFQHRAVTLNGKSYAISHRVQGAGETPVHVLGSGDPAGLDRKPANATLRMSAHAVMQEYLNLSEQLYGVVSNGRVLRLLRDSSRLVRLSFVEFDLDRILGDGLYTDFAVMYRLLHASRLPRTAEGGPDCLLERYHQDSLDSGARIRDGLSRAVEDAIRTLGTGFLDHSNNGALRQAVASGALAAPDYYRHLLRLIYRVLFLMVIEERQLVHGPEATPLQRDLYQRWYSLARLRRLSAKRWLADDRHHDLWASLCATFRLFEDGGPGHQLGLKPLAGDLFHPDAIGDLAGCTLGNGVLLRSLHVLGHYQDPRTRQLRRVNYGALNVEEFGSVYEGLLEYSAEFDPKPDKPGFLLVPGNERAATGSHYTPDELVQPLVKHSLEPLIRDCLAQPDPAQALLALRVADIACGSGHILLAAARRIAAELAVVQTGDEQPSPSAFRSALRQVIRCCIYGVDLNPLAVELCKVALWLEAHSPGEPLNFLDHHIKCGNSLVGFVTRDELDAGVSEAAFAAQSADDKAIASTLRKRNKSERALGLRSLALNADRQAQLGRVAQQWHRLSALPENTPAEIEHKKEGFRRFLSGGDASLLKHLACLPLVPFFLPKTPDTADHCLTDAEFRACWHEGRALPTAALAGVHALLERQRVFHWFLEYPEIAERGGFDCILGNPPFLGGSRISTKSSKVFLNLLHSQFAPASGQCDLAAYFFRRAFSILKSNGRMALIATNTIAQADTREGGLDVIISQGGQINYAVRSMKWPGVAALEISQVALVKGRTSSALLDGRVVDVINAHLIHENIASPQVKLAANSGLSFLGSKVLGMGFVLEPEEAQRLMERDPRNREVLLPYLNGEDLNSRPDQSPSRWVINFQDWSVERAREYRECFHRVELLVKPEREKLATGDATARDRAKRWWQFARQTMALYRAIAPLERVLVLARTSSTHGPTFCSPAMVFSEACVVLAVEAFDFFAVMQSELHNQWAWNYSSSLKNDRRYSPSDACETYPFPRPTLTQEAELARLGQALYDGRHHLQLDLQMGLTKVCNLFHTQDLTVKEEQLVVGGKVARVTYGITATEALARIEAWRGLQVELDTAVAAAYGWDDLKLDHGFHPQAHLPENDRIRFTVSPPARKELLRRLLALNHQRAAEEAAAGLTQPGGKAKGKSGDTGKGGLFDE